MKRLLIVVDYQNDFVDGSLGFPGAELLEEPIAAKIEEYRSAADVIAFTFDTHRCDYLETQEGRNLPVEHCIEGAPGHALYGRIAELIRPTDEVFEKPSFGRLVRMVARSAAAVQEHRAGGPRVQHLRDLERRAGESGLPRGARHRGRRLHRFVRRLPQREGPRRVGGPAGPSDQPGFGGLAAC